MCKKRKNLYLYYLIHPSFQGLNRIFILSFENEDDRKARTGNFLPTLEKKGYNVLIHGGNIFDKLVKNDLRIYDNI